MFHCIFIANILNIYHENIAKTKKLRNCGGSISEYDQSMYVINWSQNCACYQEVQDSALFGQLAVALKKIFCINNQWVSLTSTST